MFHKNLIPAGILYIAASLLLSGCGQGDTGSPDTVSLSAAESAHAREPVPMVSLLDRIKERGKVIVLATNSATTVYYDRDDQLTGPEYDMTQSFASALGLDVEYKLYHSTSEVLTALRQKEGDLAAAGLTVTRLRQDEFDYGPVYQTTNEYLVCHRSVKRIREPEELKDLELIVASDSSYIETLKDYPDARWTTDDDLSTSELLSQVADKKIECAASDSVIYDIGRRYHTEIQKKFIFAKDTELAWALNKHNQDLLRVIDDWFKKYQSSKDLDYMLEKYYGYTEIFDYVDTHKFLNRVETRLPPYKEFFITAAKENGIQPSILAAQSYQESHWDRKAKSPTGVRGIMMLTQPVAKSLGVTNRLHAEQNIFAGAKFHAKMKKMVEDAEEPDRTWLALAAYNVGRGHFRDAQSLAKKLGKNPDRWSEMKQVLPLLSKKEYYKDLRYGYARGNEPVQYVTRIRNYDKLLHVHFGNDEFVSVR